MDGEEAEDECKRKDSIMNITVTDFKLQQGDEQHYTER